jgi:dienelactone hydrolase
VGFEVKGIGMQETITAQARLMSEGYLQNRFKKVSRQMGYKARTAAEHKKWAKALRAKLKELTGFDSMIKTPAKAVVTESVKKEGYTRHRMEMQTEPGIVMPFYALVPEGKGPFGVVICAHGHASGGKYAPAGVTEIPVIAKQVEVYNYAYGVRFAQAGFIALCPDARGAGERQERLVNERVKGNPLTSSCLMINQMAYPLGQTVTGMWAWDILALARYSQTHKDVIKGKLACAGLSGGGLQALWAMALDDEGLIKAGVVSGYFFGYRESLLFQHANCACNYVPHLYENVDIGDVAALVAPRPLLIETGDADALNGPSGVKNVVEQVKIARKAYKRLGVEGNLVHDVFVGGHWWNGVISEPWVVKCLESLDLESKG